LAKGRSESYYSELTDIAGTIEEAIDIPGMESTTGVDYGS
jgi:hypothetical protein